MKLNLKMKLPKTQSPNIHITYLFRIIIHFPSESIPIWGFYSSISGQINASIHLITLYDGCFMGLVLGDCNSQ